MPYNLGMLTMWSIGLAWVYVACNVILIVLGIVAPDLMLSLGNDDAPPPGASFTTLMAMAGVFIAFGVAAIACYIVSAVWLYRASANAQAIDPDPDRMRPGWALGWFAIPIANLWMPFRAVKQCWNSSIHGPGALGAAAPGFFAIWWSCWIGADILAVLSYRMSSQPGVGAQYPVLWIDATQGIVACVSAMLWIRIMRGVAAAQQDHSAMSEVFA